MAFINDWVIEGNPPLNELGNRVASRIEEYAVTETDTNRFFYGITDNLIGLGIVLRQILAQYHDSVTLLMVNGSCAYNYSKDPNRLMSVRLCCKNGDMHSICYAPAIKDDDRDYWKVPFFSAMEEFAQRNIIKFHHLMEI